MTRSEVYRSSTASTVQGASKLEIVRIQFFFIWQVFSYHILPWWVETFVGIFPIGNIAERILLIFHWSQFAFWGISLLYKFNFSHLVWTWNMDYISLNVRFGGFSHETLYLTYSVREGYYWIIFRSSWCNVLACS